MGLLLKKNLCFIPQGLLGGKLQVKDSDERLKNDMNM